jgi:hypothetical protein
MNHRADYRAKVAGMQADWRRHLSDALAADSTEAPAVTASVLMALAMGLNAQLAADPAAFDRSQMAAVCDRLLAPLFRPATPDPDGAK